MNKECTGDECDFDKRENDDDVKYYLEKISICKEIFFDLFEIDMTMVCTTAE
jgi:hypothetical protein